MKTVIAYTDGGARGNPGPAAVGVHIVDADGVTIKDVAARIGNSTNNYAEYYGVMLALQTLKALYAKKTKEMQIELRMDSELVKKQLAGEYQIKEPGLVPLYMEIHNLRVAHFPNLTLTHVKRALNKEADRLVNEALDGK